MRFVMGRFMDDYPTLFEKHDMDRMIVNGEESEVVESGKEKEDEY